jgi:hypothetical protein
MVKYSKKNRKYKKKTRKQRGGMFSPAAEQQAKNDRAAQAAQAAAQAAARAQSNDDANALKSKYSEILKKTQALMSTQNAYIIAKLYNLKNENNANTFNFTLKHNVTDKLLTDFEQMLIYITAYTKKKKKKDAIAFNKLIDEIPIEFRYGKIPSDIKDSDIEEYKNIIIEQSKLPL